MQILTGLSRQVFRPQHGQRLFSTTRPALSRARSTSTGGGTTLRPRVHGNSKASKKSQHGYQIEDSDGNVMEYGISGQKLKEDGTSPRVGQKLRTKYKKDDSYSGVVVEPHLKDRQTALDWEIMMARLYKEKHGSTPPNQIRPKIED